ADINGDGRGDVIAGQYCKDGVYVYLSTGNGFAGGAQTATPPDARGYDTCVSATFVDVTGDGKDDMVAHWPDQTYIYTSIGNGNFTAATPYTLAGPNGCFLTAYGDLNGDGKVDLSKHCGPGTTITENSWIRLGSMVDALWQVSNGYGGTMTVTYVPSTN